MSAFKESIKSILSLFSDDLARKMFEERMAEEEISEADQKVILWTTFYRRNPHIFVEHYLGLELYLFQKIMIFLMFKSNLVVLICARNISKTFTTAVFAVSYCILYPNSKVLIGSYTKGQAGLIVSEKIDKELMSLCPILQDEILKIVNDQKSIGVRFHNGSNIFCTVVGEQARGYRSTCCVIDEYRLTDREALSNLIIPTMMIRNVPYMKKEKYNAIKELQEQPREVYLTSAYYKSNWYFKHSIDALKDMYKGKGLLFSTDYALCLKF